LSDIITVAASFEDWSLEGCKAARAIPQDGRAALSFGSSHEVKLFLIKVYPVY
jgi:hypothetical protein